jgi:uncharacterized protein (DUF362 family)
LSVVSICRVHNSDVERAVRHTVSLTEDFDSIHWKDANVLIKPNTVSPAQSGSGIVTDVRVIDAVTQVVLEREPKRVVIGEGSSVGYDFPGRMDSMNCMETAGVLDAAKRYGIEAVDLNRDDQVEVKLSNAFVMDTFSIAKTAANADVIISLPVLKTHLRTGITCGLKNMKGVLPGNEKKRTHQLGLDRGIVDLNRSVKPQFTIVDGIVGMQGTNNGESDRVPVGIIVGGMDVVAVDAVCATVAGFDVGDILHVTLAAEEGLGVDDLQKIEVRGESIEDVRRAFIPYRDAAKDLLGGATIIETKTCTGCMGELMSTFIYLRESGFQDRLNQSTFILGDPESVDSIKGTPVVVGKCAQEYKQLGVFVPGCPPHGKKITDATCEALEIEKEIIDRAIAKLHDF